MAEVSVLVIAYNHEKYIKECIDSILKQKTNFDIEILIHDDASTDHTQSIIRDYEKKYPKIIKSVLQEHNQFSRGKTHPDEFLFPLITGKYVAIIEGDDYWCDERKLQRQYNALKYNRGCSICVHLTQSVDDEGNPIRQVLGENLFQEGIVKNTDILDTFFCKNRWIFQTGSFFMRKEYLLNRPQFWEKFYVGDLPMILWFAYLGDYYFIDAIMSAYRRFSDGSATNLNRERGYAIRKAKTNAEGLIAFNEYTKKEYWKYLTHITSYYVYHYYSATGEVVSPDYLGIAKKELSIQEKIISRIKYTKIGYFLRNMREEVYKFKLGGRKYGK